MEQYVHRIDNNKYTKRACMVGLMVSWLVSAAALTGGSYLLNKHIQVTFTIAPKLKEMIPLFANVAVTLLNESMGYIHTCTLRWSLHREGRLKFSSNLRLLSHSRSNFANWWLANIVFFIGIVLSYASTTMIFLSINGDLLRTLHVQPGIADDRIHINPAAVLAFGIGLLIQAFITTWALINTNILSWSANPLEIVRECMVDKDDKYRIYHQTGRCMMSVHMRKQEPRSCLPLRKQKRMLMAHRYVPWVLTLSFLLTIASFACYAITRRVIQSRSSAGVLGKSWSFLPNINGDIYGPAASIANANATSPGLYGPCKVALCTTGSSIYHIQWTYRNYDSTVKFATVAIVVAFQIIPTLSLHCAELLVNLSRDEDVVRMLINDKGTNGHSNAVIAAITSWKTLFLFFSKAAIHWAFGLAISVSYIIGVCLYPTQILYFSGVSVTVPLFASFLCMRRQKGPLPSTFGHIQTIADLIDDWPDTKAMFWGHKADSITPDGPNFAGTSSTTYLRMPYFDRHYGGHTEPPTDHRGSYRGLQGPTTSPPDYEWPSSPYAYAGSGRSRAGGMLQPSDSSLGSRVSGGSSEPLMNHHY